ncbi:unnamed protein product, partial [Amoebophrya sp. A120]
KDLFDRIRVLDFAGECVEDSLEPIVSTASRKEQFGIGNAATQGHVASCAAGEQVEMNLQAASAAIAVNNQEGTSVGDAAPAAFLNSRNSSSNHLVAQDSVEKQHDHQINASHSASWAEERSELREAEENDVTPECGNNGESVSRTSQQLLAAHLDLQNSRSTRENYSETNETQSQSLCMSSLSLSMSSYFEDIPARWALVECVTRDIAEKLVFMIKNRGGGGGGTSNTNLTHSSVGAAAGGTLSQQSLPQQVASNSAITTSGSKKDPTGGTTGRAIEDT